MLFPLVGRLRERAGLERRVVRPGDDVVIEGYPRSGNSFATMAFRRAQGSDVRIGNHFHAAAQIALARRYRVPALVVIRDPIDAVLSFCVFHQGNVSVEDALCRFLAFYTPLLKVTESWVPAPFEEVTTDFAASIQRLNTHFGVRFGVYKNSSEEDAKTFQLMEQRRLERLETDRDHAGSLARQAIPSALKDELKRGYVQQLDDVKVRSLLVRSKQLYSAVLDHPSLSGA